MFVETRDLLVVVASVAFVLVLIWRNRPLLGDDDGDRPMPKKLTRELDAAKSPADKAAVLFRAGEESLRALRYGRAESYFRRALRLEPESAERVVQVSRLLERRPRGLENLLWRQLADAELEPAARRAATIAALAELVSLYERTPKQRQKAKALRLWLHDLDPSRAGSSLDD